MDEGVPNSTQTGPESSGSARPSPDEAWREVGRQFQALSESLATALRSAWESPEYRQHVQEARTSLEKAANEVSQAVKETVKSAEAQQLKGDLGKAAQSARQAARQTIQDARPHMLSALEQLRTEIDRMINHLEAEQQPPAGSQPGGTGSAQEDADPKI